MPIRLGLAEWIKGQIAMEPSNPGRFEKIAEYSKKA